jgi:aminoglycoside phosphotransferase (APT) family kinase protein
VDEAGRAWIVQATGTSNVRAVRSLNFGVSSDLTLVEADGRALVLRRWDRPDLLDQDPDVVSNEMRALKAGRAVLGGVVPEPIAGDRSGRRAGCPAVLMTRVPGASVVRDLDVGRLAAPAAALHTATVPRDLPTSQHWFDPGGLAIPAWTSAPAAWAALLDIVRGPEPAASAVFLHRDYHPGNVLWSHGAISGIVDWASASLGPPGIDVAHTRTNLALVDGVDAAAAYLAAYTARVPSYRHAAWWDAADLVGFDDDFSGVLAFNTLGARLDVATLRDRADAFAVTLARGS